MLKHLSQRSESRNSYMSDDFMVTLTALNTSAADESVFEQSTDNLSIEIPEIYKSSTNRNNSFSSLLPKPTIRKIIERRKSDLYQIDKKDKGRRESIHESEAKETLEEVQNNDSKLIIHRRKLNLSDTSAESGIDSQVTYPSDTLSKEGDSVVKDYWKTGISSPPLAFSSPTSSPVKKYPAVNNKIQDKSEQYPRTNIENRHVIENRYIDGNGQAKERNEKLTLNVSFSPKSSRSNYHERTNKESQFDSLVKRSKNNNNYLHPHSFRTDRLNRPDYNRSNNKTLPLPKSAYIIQNNNNTLPLRPKSAYSMQNNNNTLPTRPKSSYIIQNNNTLTLRPTSARSVDYWVPKKSKSRDVQSLRSHYSRGREQVDTLSISAGSSVSNLKPARPISRCSCGTLPRQNLLEKITEEMEIEHKNFSRTYDKKKKATQLVKCLCIFFSILSLISCMIAGFLHFYIAFISQEIILNQGDVKIIKESSLFCGGINAISEESGVRVITFENSDTRKSLQYTRNENVYLLPNVIWKREFYLMKESIVDIEIESDESLEILTFVGERNYTIWEQREESETYIDKVSCCRDVKEKKKSFKLITNREENYYIAIKSKELLASYVDIKLRFDRKTYDFSKTSSSCTVKKQEDCKVEYDFNTIHDIAIEVPLINTPNVIAKSTEIQWKCEARVWFYFVLFLGAFYVLFLIILAFYFLLTCYIIPTDKCSCINDTRRSINEDSVIFYDNFGKTNSDIGVMENSSYVRRHSVSTRTELKPSYGDEISRVSDTSQFLGTLFDTESNIGTMQRPQLHSDRRSNYGTLTSDRRSNYGTSTRSNRHYNGSEQGIAAIYNDDLLVEQADSGISVDPEYIPPEHSRLDAHELLYLQELQFQRLKQLRNEQRQAEMVEAPSIKNLLRRPISTMEPNQQHQAYNEPVVQQLNKANVEYHRQRPHSVISERNYYKDRNDTFELQNRDQGEVYL